ncbi:hypothetical protein HDU76_001723 [Blyttiomyces sp. JEL0837]|nr:hypothetical protein HDU76_001723 [Blyttiomyces sp. JEL0837]
MIFNVNLFWLFFAIPATFGFAYVSSAGLMLILSTARSLPRVRLIQIAVVISLLFGTYAACFTPAPRNSLTFINDIVKTLIGGNGAALMNGDLWGHHTATTSTSGDPLDATASTTMKPTFPRGNWFRLPLPLVVTQTTGISHALCVAIGLFVVQWVSSFIDRMKKRGVDEYQLTFIQANLFNTPPTTTITDPDIPTTITTLAASILGLSHTLAFSIGFYIHHDYHARGLDKRTESDVMRYYLSCAGVLVAGRLAFQAVCNATGLDPTSHDILLLSAAISTFILLNSNSHSLMNYFWLPLAAGLISVIPALDRHPIVLSLLPYVSNNRELLTLSLVGAAGFILGVRWAVKPLLAAATSSLMEVGAGVGSNGLSFGGNSGAPASASTVMLNGSSGNGSGAVAGRAARAGMISQKKRALKFPPPFPNGWYSLAISEEVKEKEVINVSALGRHFAVFRGEDGSVGALDAMCPHLGANIAVGGKVIGNAVECPFHGWQFDKSGKCTHIPYADNVPDVAKTKMWPTREIAGNIMIWFDAEERAPLYEPRAFPLQGKNYYHVTGRSATLPMHIQDFAENAADWMHFGQVHSRLALPIIDRFFYVKHKTRWSPAPADGNEGPLLNTELPIPIDDTPANSSSAVSRLGGPRIQKDADGKIVPTKHFMPPNGGPDLINTYPDSYHFTFYDVPSLHSVFSDAALPSGNVYARVEFTGQGGLVYFRFSTPYGEVVAVKTFLPVGESGLMLHMRDAVYAENSVPWIFARHVWNEAAHAFDDDIFLWTNKTYHTRPVLIKEDRPVKRFREWYVRHYSPNSRTFAYENLEW